jgi:hypothetical protein
VKYLNLSVNSHLSDMIFKASLCESLYSWQGNG